eukprot:m.845941 g.845941  ORF g.845941 m.845941 type:complete len:1144 (+) comp59554_c0_seq31:109-3540(+)
MSGRIPFSVVFAAGAADGHAAVNLQEAGPAARGWQSARYCLFPQEIVVQLEDTTRLRKLQILAHQYKIPTRIEFFIGVVPSDKLAVRNISYKDCVFERLGHVSFEDNRASNFQTRELKSVHVDAICRYIRIIVHKNHVNELNLYNQVGIVAVNVIGEGRNTAHAQGGFLVESQPPLLPTAAQLQAINAARANEIGLNRDRGVVPDIATLGVINRLDKVALTEDLAFNVYQDPQTAAAIRTLLQLKEEAVQSHNYARAGQLKQMVQTLQLMGEELGRLERIKASAVAKEDFQTAALIQDQTATYRFQVFSSLGLNEKGQLAFGGQNPSQPAPQPIRTFAAAHTPPLPAIRKAQESALPAQEGNAPQPPLSAWQAKPPRVPAAPAAAEDDRPINPAASKQARVSFGDEQGQELDLAAAPSQVFSDPLDRPLPTMGKKKTTSAVRNEDISNDSPTQAAPKKKSKEALDASQLESGADGSLPNGDEADSKAGTVTLTAKMREEYAVVIEIFGEQVVCDLLSKPAAVKQQAASTVLKALPTSAIRDANSTKVVQACTLVAKSLLKEKVAQVWQKGCELVKDLLTKYSKKVTLRSNDLVLVCETIVPLLIAKTAETTASAREWSRSFVVDMSQFASLKDSDAFMTVLLRKPKPKALWKELEGNLQCIESILLVSGLSEDRSGLTASSIVDFVNPCLKNAKGEVRDAGLSLAVQLYLLDPTIEDELQLDGKLQRTFRDWLLTHAQANAAEQEASPAKPQERQTKGAASKRPVPKDDDDDGDADNEDGDDDVSQVKAPPPKRTAAPAKAPAKAAKPGLAVEKPRDEDVAASPSPQKAAKAVPPSKAKGPESLATRPKGPESLANKAGSQLKQPPVSDAELSDMDASPRPGGNKPGRAPTKAEKPAALMTEAPPGKQKPGHPRQQEVLSADEASAVDEPEEGDEELMARTCFFCHEVQPTADPDAFDIHYWKACRMLKLCQYCRQVVEVPALHDHWLKECSAKRSMKVCPRCKEVKHDSHYNEHVKKKTCNVAVAPTIAARCPLCHQNIAVGNQGWRDHLLTPGVCRRHARRGSAASTGSVSELPVQKPASQVKAPSGAPPKAGPTTAVAKQPAPRKEADQPAPAAALLSPSKVSQRPAVTGRTGIPMPKFS